MTNDLTFATAAAEQQLAAAIRLRGERVARGLVPFALATLSGLLFAAAFPPLAWTVAAWVALVPLLVACAMLSPGRAFVAGLCWTAAIAAGAASFFPAMLAGYFGLGAVSSWLAALVIIGGLHGLVVAAYAAWVAWLVRRGAAAPLLLAGGWVVCELVRTWGAPWALVANSQVEWTALVQSADLAGPYGIAMLVAAVNACAAALVVPALRGGRPRVAAAMTIAALGAVLLYGRWRLAESFDDGPAVPVSVVQGGAPPAERAQRPVRLARYVALSSSAAAAHAGLIVWPEHSVDAYLEERSPARDAVLRVGAGADLILGGPHYEGSAAGTRYHNSAYLVRGGHLAGRYDKHRLVPVAEDDRLAWLRGDTSSAYSAGEGSFVLPTERLRAATAICFEIMYPALIRSAVTEGAEVLVNLSNDAWFGQAGGARQQLATATLRAIENRRYLVRAAATGFSAVIDPHGRTQAVSRLDSFQVLNATVRAAHARTPYQRWGDAFAWLVAAGVAAATLRTHCIGNDPQQQQ